MIGLLQIL